jgi:diguanylate cyclase (GGDEF)-like protein/PAS domain S-box-containing protein
MAPLALTTMQGQAADALRAGAPPRRLVARISLMIGLVGSTLALLLGLLGTPLIEHFETQRHLAQITDLIKAVENTASIACFTDDKTLGLEVVRGLADNPEIASVRIVAANQTLAQITRDPGELKKSNPQTVRHTLFSPFDKQAVVGEIVLIADSDAILAQAHDYSRIFAGLLLLEMVAVVLVVMLVVLRQVVRPISQLSHDLQSIEGRVDQSLPIPPGQHNNEIGHLALAFNRMIASAAGLIEREQGMMEEIARSAQRFRALVENSPDIIVRLCPQGRLLFTNPACVQETGLHPALTADGSIPFSAWRPSIPLSHFLQRVSAVAATHNPDTLYWEWETDAGPICHEIHLVAEHDVAGAPIGVLGIGRDVSARRAAERQLRHQATHDALTLLPNRVLLQDRLQHAIRRSRRDGQRGAVVFADLDNFKDVNDSLGHDVGDELLKIVAQRMSAALRENDTVARLGGDEFVMVVEDANNSQHLESVVQRLFESISESCEVAGRRIYPRVSLGIAVYPDDGGDADTVMRNADIAMYAAKEQGRNNYRYFAPEMNEDLKQWIAITTDLRQALEKQEFELHYQPKVQLQGRGFQGMEALIRWRHPVRGLVSPTTFIPIAEDIGLIGAIGDWVLDEACRQMRAWLDEGLNPGRVAVNLSAAQYQGGALPERIRTVLASHRLPSHYLEVEITESIFMNDTAQAIQAFEALRAMNIKVSIDDFGTGYSSLGYLKRFPVDTVKIDKSFIDDIETQASDLEIVKAIIAIAHSIHLTVIAEGVETAGQFERLRDAGCEQAQGYFYSRPLSAPSMTEFLQTHSACQHPTVQ